MTVLRVIRNAKPPSRLPKGEVKSALAKLAVGDALDWYGSRHSIRSAAGRMGIRIRTEQRGAALFRIWRTE